MIRDIIGDIHGHASALLRLLAQLGYVERNGVFSHPDADRHAIFVGDFIDRGPDIVLALEVVRKMVERGSAEAVLGNHEYNALCFHRSAARDSHRWLRPRSDKNLHQHLETLYQFRNLRTRWDEYLEWFATLPLFLDDPAFRVVHASWHEPSIVFLRELGASRPVMDRAFLEDSAESGTAEHDAVENVLKGPEVALPAGMSYSDKDGHVRTRTRVAWWMDARGRSYADLKFPAYAVEGPSVEVLQEEISPGEAEAIPGYNERIPVFFGHYWLSGSSPGIQTPQVCCVDYSVARGGYLAAYTWSGEMELSDDRFTLTR